MFGAKKRVAKAIIDEKSQINMDSALKPFAKSKFDDPDADRLAVVAELPENSEDEIMEKLDKEAFLQQMQARGLELKTVDQDGNCVFRAIARLLFDDESRHMQVRHDIVTRMLACKQLYESKVPFTC